MADSKVFKLKVSLLGDGAVGKTSLIKKYVYDEFDDKYLLTLGAKTTLKKIAMETEESKTGVELNDEAVKEHLRKGAELFAPTPEWDEPRSWDRIWS